MSKINHTVERLIVHRLDGCLSEDEALALDRSLIRDPEARRTMEDYQRIDDLAGAALRKAFETQTDVNPAFRLPRKGAVSTRSPLWVRTLIPGAIAAALLIVVSGVLPRLQTHSPESTVRSAKPDPSMGRIVPAPSGSDAGGDVMRNAAVEHDARSGPRIWRNTGREVLGVVGEDGNFYWIEIERTRTVRRSKARSRNPL